MSIQTLSKREESASLLLKWLNENQAPVSLQELETRFGSQKKLSHRALKEIAWKLVEEGKIKFTSSWELEVC